MSTSPEALPLQYEVFLKKVISKYAGIAHNQLQIELISLR